MLQYPSHRPVPRMVLASTLEKLSDNPRYLAAVLLDSSRPWNDRLDELHDAGIPVIRFRTTLRTMHPQLAGITIIGPLAATMSTVSSLLIAASSTVVRDLYEKSFGKK